MKTLLAIKSLLSLKVVLMGVMVTAVAGGLIGGGLFAYFSDTETSTGNTFTAGTIDIAVDDDNPWNTSYYMEVKPCEVGEIDFYVENVGTNAVDVWKRVQVMDVYGGDPMYPPGPSPTPIVSSEPELEAEGGVWDPFLQDWDLTFWEPDDFIFDETVYDIYSDACWIYEEDMVFLSEIVGYWMYLGQIDAGYGMEVHQSYHLLDFGYPQNYFQGDTIIFDIDLYAQQTTGGEFGDGPPPPGPEWGWCSKQYGPF